MSEKLNAAIAVIGIDIGKNSFHIVGHNHCGAIVLRQRWSRGQVEARLANLPPCLIGMEACVGAHHLSRKLQMFGPDTRLMPAKYVRPYSKGQKNDFRNAEAICEAVQRPNMKFVATKTADQLDLQVLHRVRDRLVSVPASSIRSVRSCWSGTSPCGKACIPCGPSCRVFSRRAPMCSRLACYPSSKLWRETGAGWMSVSRNNLARSKRWPVKIRPASD
jgi:Transposase